MWTIKKNTIALFYVFGCLVMRLLIRDATCTPAPEVVTIGLQGSPKGHFLFFFPKGHFLKQNSSWKEGAPAHHWFKLESEMLWFRSRSFWPSGGIVRSLKSQTPTPPSLQGQACRLLAFLSYVPSSSPAKVCTIALGLSYLHSENEVFPTVSKSTHFWNYRFRRQW